MRGHAPAMARGSEPPTRRLNWSQEAKGGDAMPRLHVEFALKAVATRRACAAYEYLMAAVLTANKLPKPVRLALRDRMREHANDRKGQQRDLMRAYATFLEEPLGTAQILERQEPYGLQLAPPLAPFIEDEADESDDGGADEAVEQCPDALCLGAIGRTPGRATVACSGSCRVLTALATSGREARRASRRASIRAPHSQRSRPRSTPRL
jgi:hypothetical protein